MDTTGDTIIFEKFPLETKECDPEINFTGDLSENLFTRNLTQFTCMDNSDLYFQGTTVSPQHSYLHFELLECDEEILHQNEGYGNATCASELEVKNFFYSHIMLGYVTNTFVNKTEFTDNPVSTLNDLIFYE